MTEPVGGERGLLTPLTIANFLLGRQHAIMQVAETPAALWIGGLFVLSAGLAREYDGEDLVAEPWHLAIPFIASLGTSLLMFACVYTTLRMHGNARTGFWRLYSRFLATYWMTAPLAWLYAIPVERWLDAAESVRWNLMFLAVVSLWRVVLMIRVVTVLFGATVQAAAALVLAIAATVSGVAAYALPMPVISIMGGVRLSESENLIQLVMFSLRLFTPPAAIILWLFALGYSRKPDRPWYAWAPAGALGRVHPALWCLAALSVLAWIPLAQEPQREQRLRRNVELQFAEGQIEAAVQLMSAHSPSDFPPHWDAPPRAAYGQRKPLVTDVLLAARRNDATDWVSALYLRKLEDQFARDFSFDFYLRRLSVDEAERFATAFEELPEVRRAIADTRFRFTDEVGPDEFQSGYGTEEAERMFAVMKRLVAANRQDDPNSAATGTSEPSKETVKGAPGDDTVAPAVVEPLVHDGASEQ